MYYQNNERKMKIIDDFFFESLKINKLQSIEFIKNKPVCTINLC